MAPGNRSISKAEAASGTGSNQERLHELVVEVENLSGVDALNDGQSKRSEIGWPRARPVVRGLCLFEIRIGIAVHCTKPLARSRWPENRASVVLGAIRAASSSWPRRFLGERWTARLINLDLACNAFDPVLPSLDGDDVGRLAQISSCWRWRRWQAAASVASTWSVVLARALPAWSAPAAFASDRARIRAARLEAPGAPTAAPAPAGSQARAVAPEQAEPPVPVVGGPAVAPAELRARP